MENLSELEGAGEALPVLSGVAVPPSRGAERTLWRMLRFGAVGVSNTLIDILLLNVLIWRFPTHNAELLLLYNSISATVAALNSFLGNKYWTFKQKHHVRVTEIARFALVTGLSFLCNDGIIWGAAHLLHALDVAPFLWANLSKLSAVVCTTIISYVGMRFWVFTGASQASRRTDGA